MLLVYDCTDSGHRFEWRLRITADVGLDRFHRTVPCPSCKAFQRIAPDPINLVEMRPDLRE